MHAHLLNTALLLQSAKICVERITMFDLITLCSGAEVYKSQHLFSGLLFHPRMQESGMALSQLKEGKLSVFVALELDPALQWCFWRSWSGGRKMCFLYNTATGHSQHSFMKVLLIKPEYVL